MEGWSLRSFLPPSTRGPVLPGFLVPTLMKDLNESHSAPAAMWSVYVLVRVDNSDAL